MLIEDGKFNQKEFKEWFDKLDWIFAPRILKGGQEKFFIGRYEDEDMKIQVKVRPSMRMEISETFKKKDINGLDVKPNYRGQLFEFGTTVEVLVDQKFWDKLEAKAKPLKIEKRERLEW